MSRSFELPRAMARAFLFLASALLLAACSEAALQPDRAASAASAATSSPTPADIEAAVNAAAERDLQATPPDPGELRQEYLPTVAMHGDRAERTVRLRLRDRAGTWERWWLQRQVFVRDGASWRKVDSADVLLYQGKPLHDQMHARYGGTFMIEPGQALQLAWQGGVLLARFPDGSTRQVFLASPTEEAPGASGEGHLRFTLSDDGRPATVTFVRDGKELWRAPRAAPGDL